MYGAVKVLLRGKSTGFKLCFSHRDSLHWPFCDRRQWLHWQQPAWVLWLGEQTGPYLRPPVMPTHQTKSTTESSGDIRVVTQKGESQRNCWDWKERSSAETGLRMGHREEHAWIHLRFWSTFQRAQPNWSTAQFIGAAWRKVQVSRGRSSWSVDHTTLIALHLRRLRQV